MHVQIREVAARPIAAVRGRVALDSLPGFIAAGFDQVRSFCDQLAAAKPGRNIVLYRSELWRNPFASPYGIMVDVGVEIDAAFAGSGPIARSETPAGVAATTVHMGPYEGLHATHLQLQEWCREYGRVLAGPFWEVYEPWHERPELRRTEIFHLLQ